MKRSHFIGLVLAAAVSASCGGAFRGSLLVEKALNGSPRFLPDFHRTIEHPVSVIGPGLERMSFNNLGTPAPLNDDVDGNSPNWISINQKAYNAVSYIDMVFVVVDSAGPATEYVLSEGVHNGTGIPWTDYHLELGFGVGAGFVPSTPGDGLDFDSPDLNSPFVLLPFATLNITEDTVDAFDGTILPGSFNVFSFPIDVPTGSPSSHFVSIRRLHRFPSRRVPGGT